MAGGAKGVKRMGFLGTKASPISDLILIGQTAGFLVLFSAFVYARKQDFLKHDKMAKIAVLPSHEY